MPQTGDTRCDLPCDDAGDESARVFVQFQRQPRAFTYLCSMFVCVLANV